MSNPDHRRALNDDELQYFAEHLSEISEDVNFSDVDSLDDPEYSPDNIVEEQEQDESSDEEQTNLSNVLPSGSKSKTARTEIKWKKKNLVLNEAQLCFRGNLTMSKALLEMGTPYECFQHYFSDDLLEKIVQESNLYAQQTDLSKPLNLSVNELRRYIGIIIYMSLVRLPNTRYYWTPDIGIDVVANSMTVNRFEKIRQYLHFNDNDQHLPRDHSNHDRLHKIRPIITHLKAKCSTVPLEAHLSVDEQLCSTKVHHYMKQYLPMKPHKWGFKLFVLCGVSGYAYDFEIYSGQENNDKQRIDAGEPDLGAAANVVVRLARSIPKNQNYRLYCDNYYTSPRLMAYLAQNGIYSLGTVRRNRITSCKLPSEKDMKKDPRGTSYEFVGDLDDISISSLVWKDNKVVTLLSTFAGELPLSTINRYDKRSKSTSEISCPFVVKEYNRHMGGVDLLDAFMARHKILLKSKKWYIRLFYHFLDMALANSWILFKKISTTKQSGQEMVTFFEFRKQVALCLLNIGQYNPIKRGRPSSSTVEEMMNAKKKSGPAQHAPPKNVRLDQVGHWIIWTDIRGRCKFPNCKGYTQTLCDKCGVNLCCNKKNNCFKDYHTTS